MNDPPISAIDWPQATRIIRSRVPPVDLFEDIADPADWDLLAAAESRTNPRLLQAADRLDLVPREQQVAGPGASLIMAPFTHVSRDRPSRFSAGDYGLWYCAREFETALFETIHHHQTFLRATAQKPGWTSDFRELTGHLAASLHDLCDQPDFLPCLDPDNYSAGQTLGKRLRETGSHGLVWPSVRWLQGTCAGLFRPDTVPRPVQGRHFGYHWNGQNIDRFRDHGSRKIYQVSPA